MKHPSQQHDDQSTAEEPEIKKVKYVFITGGVSSSLGKGIVTASLGALIIANGYKVRLRKLDPYLNIDPGTMSPEQHGEVFVTDDACEADLDLGHYERFTDTPCSKNDSITAGRVYETIIAKERRGDYLGGTVQVIPHVTDEIKKFILAEENKTIPNCDFMMLEIGGTVGDIESLPFLESIRQLRYELGDRMCHIHLTLVPYIDAARELKTKPTQNSVKELRSLGLQPDILVLRCPKQIKISESEKKKIALFCNVKMANIISGETVSSIYRVPLALHKENLDGIILKHFNLQNKTNSNLEKWQRISKSMDTLEKTLTVGVMGKYLNTHDSYKSIEQAIFHAGIANKTDIKIEWLNSETINKHNKAEYLSEVNGIIVPGAFGARGLEGKMLAAKYAREHNVPYLGICFGMQVALIEFARNVLGLTNATSSEFVEETDTDKLLLVKTLKEWLKDNKEITYNPEKDGLGGTMRKGSYVSYLKENSKVRNIYKSEIINERHRHRYEISKQITDQLKQNGMIFSGMSENNALPEILEITSHPWFIGVQFHPELKSRPFNPHPLFNDFVKTTLEIKENKTNQQ